MTGVNPNYVFGGAVAIILALIGSDLALALHGSTTGAIAIGFLAGFLTLASNIVSHALGVSAGGAAAAKAVGAVNPGPPAKP